MKVLHIALSDRGGAGAGMLTQHLALLAQGIDSKVLVASKRTDLDTIFQVEPNQYVWGKGKVAQFLQKVARRMGLCLNRYDHYKRRVYKIRRRHWTEFALPITSYDLSTHPLVQEADIINLHFVADFLDYESFFRKVNKPIVWTMRDENPGLGGFHYSSTKSELYSYFADLEDEFADIKLKALAKCEHLHIVALSHQMRNFCAQSQCFAGRPITIIPNAINADNFRPYRRHEARQHLGIGENDLAIAFVSCAIEDERKGFRELALAVQQLEAQTSRPINVLCVGANEYNGPVPSNCRFFGHLNTPNDLSGVYSAADVFASPSYQESFGKTVVEALCCGTPVVSTPVGIAPEIINERNGALCRIGDVDDLARALHDVFNRTYDKESIRREAREHFLPQSVAKQYIKLYEDVLASATSH